MMTPATASRTTFDPPLPKHPRYRSLELWRGVACLMVVVYHTAALAVRENAADRSPAGRVLAATHWLANGVPIFFVISGYCIAATADATRRRGTVADYFRRRLRRIYPPYYAALLLCFAFYLAIDAPFFPGSFGRATDEPRPPWALSPAQWLGNLTLTESWLGQLTGEPTMYVVNVAWTLCYEEQFYLVMGLILLACPRRMFAASLGVTLATLAALHGGPRLGLKLPHGVFFDGGWLSFALGILVYHRANYGGKREAWAVPAFCTLAILYAHRVNNEMLGTAGGFALVASLLLAWDERIASARIGRPLSAAGAMCYSLYLTHAPVVRVVRRGLFEAGLRSPASTLLVTVPLGMLAAIIVAWPFYWFVERRFLNTRRPDLARATAAETADFASR